MKKITILLIALMVISVGFLCGCNSQNQPNIQYHPSWRGLKSSHLENGENLYFGISGETIKWKIEWLITYGSGSPSINVYKGYLGNELFDKISTSGSNGEKLYSGIGKDSSYTLEMEGGGGMVYILVYYWW